MSKDIKKFIEEQKKFDQETRKFIEETQRFLDAHKRHSRQKDSFSYMLSLQGLPS